MAYINKTYLQTQFQNFATRISTIFAKKTELPTKTSDLTNDSNFVEDANYVHTDNNYTVVDKTKVDNAVIFTPQALTEEQKAQARANIGAGDSEFSGDYNDLINKPTKLSEFDNDQNFIIKTVNDLTNYYLKTETYNKDEVDSLISSIITFGVEVVDVLPTENISTHTIYLVPKETEKESDVYDEYINVDGTVTGWEHIGSTEITIDLSDYLKKTEAEQTYATIESLSDYILYTDTEKENIDFSHFFN